MENLGINFELLMKCKDKDICGLSKEMTQKAEKCSRKLGEVLPAYTVNKETVLLALAAQYFKEHEADDLEVLFPTISTSVENDRISDKKRRSSNRDLSEEEKLGDAMDALLKPGKFKEFAYRVLSRSYSTVSSLQNDGSRFHGNERRISCSSSIAKYAVGVVAMMLESSAQGELSYSELVAPFVTFAEFFGEAFPPLFEKYEKEHKDKVLTLKTIAESTDLRPAAFPEVPFPSEENFDFSPQGEICPAFDSTTEAAAGVVGRHDFGGNFVY